MPTWEGTLTYYVKAWNGDYHSKNSNLFTIKLEDPCLEALMIDDRDILDMETAFENTARQTFVFTDSVSTALEAKGYSCAPYTYSLSAVNGNDYSSFISLDTNTIVFAPNDVGLIGNTYSLKLVIGLSGDYAGQPTITKYFDVRVTSCSLTSVLADQTLDGSVTYATAGDELSPITFSEFTFEPVNCPEFSFFYSAVQLDETGDSIDLPPFLTFDVANRQFVFGEVTIAEEGSYTLQLCGTADSLTDCITLTIEIFGCNSNEVFFESTTASSVENYVIESGPVNLSFVFSFNLDDCTKEYILTNQGQPFDSNVITFDSQTADLTIETNDPAYRGSTMVMTVTARSVEAYEASPRLSTNVEATYTFTIAFDDPCVIADFTSPSWNYQFLTFFVDVYDRLEFEFGLSTSSVDCGDITYTLYDETDSAIDLVDHPNYSITYDGSFGYFVIDDTFLPTWKVAKSFYIVAQNGDYGTA